MPAAFRRQRRIAALYGDQAPVAEMAAAYRDRHDFLVGALNDIDGFECRLAKARFTHSPGSAARSSEQASQRVQPCRTPDKRRRRRLRTGRAFGAPGYLRLSFACSMEMLEEAVDRIKRVASDLTSAGR